MKKVFRIIANVLATMLLILMIILVFFLLSAKLSPDGVSSLGSYQVMVVLSGSMSPEFEAGDVIIVTADSKAQYGVGDVITFWDPEDGEKIITHRVVETVQDGNALKYRTKGDANDSADPLLIPTNNVIGQQVWSIPYFGRVVEFAKTKAGIVALIVVPGLIIIISEFRNLVNLLREEELKRQLKIEENRQGEVDEWYSRD